MERGALRRRASGMVRASIGRITVQMFYVVSKVVWFLGQPSTLLLGAVVLGIALLARGRIVTGARLSIGAIVALMIIGLTGVGDLLYLPLESRFPRADLTGQRITGIIVLGGGEDDSGEDRELMSLNDAGERLTEAAALARRLPEAKLVWSGGAGLLSVRQDAAGRQARRLWESLGIEPHRVVLETRSKTTHENAAESFRLLKPQPGDRFALVTSAWHMPRAIGCFRAAGFDVVAWPADYRTSGGVNPFFLGPSIPYGLVRFDTIVKEYVGLLAYRLTGLITDIWPGP
jgi:uncharacterized SAM-binding protein YcdF (DUF218 family)